CLFLFSSYAVPPALDSFPTRRSSDLVYDGNVSLANLQGANRAYIEREIPHIASLMCDSIDALLQQSDVVVIGNGAKAFRQALEQDRKSTRLNSSHVKISYAVFCLKKK